MSNDHSYLLICFSKLYPQAISSSDQLSVLFYNEMEWILAVEGETFWPLFVLITQGLIKNLTVLLLNFCAVICLLRPPLWSSGQSFWLQIQRSRVRFPALPDFLSGSGSGTGYTQPREVN